MFTYFGFFCCYYNSSVFSVNPDYKCEITLSLRILEGTNSRASIIMDYFPQLLKNQEFWSTTLKLKELYCVCDAA